nr:translation initiation factor IF-2-like [Aegilops tauschii subsp. strangulata]
MPPASVWSSFPPPPRAPPRSPSSSRRTWRRSRPCCSRWGCRPPGSASLGPPPAAPPVAKLSVTASPPAPTPTAPPAAALAPDSTHPAGSAAAGGSGAPRPRSGAAVGTSPTSLILHCTGPMLQLLPVGDPGVDGETQVTTPVAAQPPPPRSRAYSRRARSASSPVTASRRSARLDAACPEGGLVLPVRARAELRAAARNLELASSYTTTATIWNVLLQSFASQSRARVIQLHSANEHTRKGDLSAAAYFTKMVSISDELAAADKPLDEDDVISHILQGLLHEPDYNGFVSAISTRTITDQPIGLS